MKKGLLRQLLFFLFVSGVGAFAYYEYLQSVKEKETETEKTLFLSQELEELVSVKILKNKEQIEIVKKDQDWFLKKPIEDFASFSEVSRWFDEIKNQKVREIPVEGAIDWKNYHLEKGFHVELGFQEGKTASFSISQKGSFDGHFFVKKEGKLFLVEKYFDQEINQKVWDSFRSKKVLPSLGHASQIILEGKKKLALNWSDYRWSLGGGLKFPLEEGRLNNFWTSLNSTEAVAVKEKVTPDRLKKYRLQNPQLQISLVYDKDTKVEIKMSSFKEEKAYVFSSHRDYILEISEEEGKKWLLSEKDIRDHGFPFRYKKEQAFYLDLKSEKKSYSLEKKGTVWTSLSSEKKTVDEKKMEALLNAIHNLKGEEYKKGSLKKLSGNSLVIKDDSGGLLFEMKTGPVSGSLLWVKTNLFEDSVAVSKQSFDHLLDKDLYVSEKPPEKSTEELRQKPKKN